MTKLIKKSEQYAINCYKDKTGNSSIFVGDNCFDVDDIEVAYEDGRQSVLDDIPELKWKKIYFNDNYFEYFSSELFGFSYKICPKYDFFELKNEHNDSVLINESLSNVKKEAIHNIKLRIGEILGL